MNTLLLDALKGKNTAVRPPIWLMRQAGRYMPSYRSFREKYSLMTLFTEPELIAKITLLPIQELHLDAAILFSDILMIPKALGFQLRFDEEKGPIIDNPLKDSQDLAKHSSNALLEHISFLRPAIQELKKQLRVPLIGFAGAPFTLASYLIEGKTSRTHQLTKAWAYQDYESFEKIIHFLEEAVVVSLKEQIDAGCDVVQLFDSWAGVLSEEHFQAFCLAPLKRIQEKLNNTNTPMIYFCRGSSFLAERIAKTKVSAISVDWLRPINQVRKLLPDVALQGNLDPEALYMPEKELVQKTRQILASMHRDPAFIFNLGHGVLPSVPYQNVKALVDTVLNSN